MTVREALNQPITLQALLTLAIGIGIGITVSIANVAVFGSLLATGPETACTQAVTTKPRS